MSGNIDEMIFDIVARTASPTESTADNLNRAKAYRAALLNLKADADQSGANLGNGIVQIDQRVSD